MTECVVADTLRGGAEGCELRINGLEGGERSRRTRVPRPRPLPLEGGTGVGLDLPSTLAHPPFDRGEILPESVRVMPEGLSLPANPPPRPPLALPRVLMPPLPPRVDGAAGSKDMALARVDLKSELSLTPADQS